MSLIEAMLYKTAYSYEDAFRARDITSQQMREAIAEWFSLYYNQTKTEYEDPCQRIAYTVVKKLEKTTFGEYKATSTDTFAQMVLDALGAEKAHALQLALIGGEALIKPWPTADSFGFTVIPRSNMLIFGRDAAGRPTDIGTAEVTVQGNQYYTLLERRTVERGYLTIRNRLYQSETRGALGRQVSLASLARYEALPEEYTFPVPLDGLGCAVLRVPMENCIDGSADGVSVYAAAVGLIHNIDRNEAQLSGEFERGESRIIASADMLKKDRDGKRKFRDNLFVGLDDDPEMVGVTIFSPQLRDASFLARKTEYLRNVESVIGIKRGLLSEVEAAERTAREITSSEGDYNLTIIDLQRMFEAAVRETVRICGVLGQLYRVPGAHAVDPDTVTIDWGNGILYDEDKTWSEDMAMVNAGMLKPEIALGHRFHMPSDTPEQLAAIRAKYMPETQLGAGEA